MKTDLHAMSPKEEKELQHKKVALLEKLVALIKASNQKSDRIIELLEKNYEYITSDKFK